MSIRIVLVGTSHPGNIGSAARAMKTMGLESLWLVAPERFPATEATVLAAGADDVLQRARVVPELHAAIADCGLIVGTPELIEFAQVVLPPYTFPTPSIELVPQALSQDSLKVSEERVVVLKRERERLAAALRDVPQVLQVYPSDANFILVRTRDGQAFRETARRANILVRTFDDPLLKDCVRITVGLQADNDLLLQAVSQAERKRHA